METLTAYRFEDDSGETWLSTSSEPSLHKGRIFRPWMGTSDGPYREIVDGSYVGPLYDYSAFMCELYPRN